MRQWKGPGHSEASDLAVPAAGAKPGGRATAKTTAQLQRSGEPRPVDYTRSTWSDADGAQSGADPALYGDLSGGSATGMPAPVQAKMESSFGSDFSDVRIHQGGEAASLGALAYTQGSDIHFAPGQYNPGSTQGQELLGHELAHVVQQREGRVAPTAQAKGVDLNDDVSLEREADEMGARAARGEAAGRGAGGSSEHAGQATQLKAVVQLKGEPTLRKGSSGQMVKTLQQRLNAKAVVEPPLKIDGDFGPKTKAAVVAFQSSHTDAKGKALDPDGVVGKGTWAAINDERDTPEIANTEEGLGEHIATEMDKNNSDPHEADRGVHYDFNYKSSFPDKWKDDYSNGLADPVYFDRIGWMDWRLKPKVSASAAIQSWLRGLTIAECNSAIVAIQTDAVRAAIGDTKFDANFGATDKAIPEAKRMRIKTGTDGTVVDGMNIATDANAKGDAGTFGHRPVKKGDWCYFYNHPMYLLKHPGGAFQGENSIYVGDDSSGTQLWSGMGVARATEQEMLEAMIGAYNNPRDEWDVAALERIKTSNGGVLPTEYDETSGPFPPSLSAPADILGAPAYTINGTARKGGFVADAPTHLDTAKVAAIK